MSIPNLKDELQYELDDQMQKGYSAFLKGDSVAASKTWIDLWEMIKETMDQYKIEFIEDMDEAFHGQQIIYNWSTDFEAELSNASTEDKSFLQKRIDFCSEYIAKSKNKDDLNNLARKRVIAESHFMLGNVQEGEKLFKEYTEKYPKDGWGWVNWSDQYGVFARKENRDNEKAIAILKSGLEVTGLNDRYDVLDRLESLYSESGMKQEANASNVTTVHSKKIGRNEPCPCGSGKKYKKCCGK